jgi:hypothetical protein
MQDFLISLLACFMVWLIWNGIARARAKRKAAKGEGVAWRQPDLERTRSLYYMTLCKLEQKGHSDLMMTDYHIRTRVDPPAKTDIAVLQRQLQSVLMELLAHLHLMPNVRLIVTQDASKLVNKGAMGEYDGDVNDKKIRLLVLPEYTAESVVAALCHECAHCFAYSCGIAETDKDANEGMTDTLTILLGFSEAILSSHGNRALPYLNEPEFQELRRLLLEYRKTKKAKQAAAQDLSAARTQLKKNIAGARDMLGHAQAMISVKKSPAAGKRMSKAELTELQKILLDFESGSYQEVLDGAQRQADGSLEQVRRADDRVLDVCAKTYKLMLAFR